MYLDTIAAVLVKDNLYRYGFIGTWHSILFNSEDLCQHYMKISVRDYCKSLHIAITQIPDNEVTMEILQKAPCNSVTIVNKNGDFLFLKTNPTPGLDDAEKYIQEQMKTYLNGILHNES